MKLEWVKKDNDELIGDKVLLGYLPFIKWSMISQIDYSRTRDVK